MKEKKPQRKGIVPAGGSRTRLYSTARAISNLAGQASALIPGEYVFYGQDLQTVVQGASDRNVVATIFAYRVSNPEAYAVIQFDDRGAATDIVEKPKKPSTPSPLLQVSLFIEITEQRQGLKIACPEEIAFRMGFISKSDLETLARDAGNNAYGDYLTQILAE